MVVGVAGAVIALAAALSGYVMVKFYGIVFLGQTRDARLAANFAEIRDAGRWERTGLAWLAAGCIVLGLAPATVIGMLDPITRGFTGFGMASLAQGWLYLAPIEPQRPSYSAVLFFAGAALLVA